MENEDAPTTEFDFIVHEPVEPVTETEPIHYESVNAEQEPESVPESTITGSDLAAIYIMIKSIRRGEWGEGDERAENLLAAGFDHNSVVAVVYEADNPK